MREDTFVMIMLVQNSKRDLKKLEECVRAVFPDDEIVSFRDQNSAVEYADSHKVDICYADVKFKNEAGIFPVEELKMRNQDMRINLLSERPDYAVYAWKLHVNDYILKPVTVDAIRHTIGA